MTCPLLRWLHEVIFPAEAANVNPEMVYWGTLLSCVEMLKNGHNDVLRRLFFEEAAAQAAMDSGMRAILGQGVLDFPTPDQPDPSRSRDRVETFLDSFPRKVDRVRPSIFCHTPKHVQSEDPPVGESLSRIMGCCFRSIFRDCCPG